MLALRELGVLRFSLPEKRCQTDRNWAYSFGWVPASALWGFHIGLGFVTVITYGGFWSLVALSAVLGDPVLGVILMGSYWVGRILPLWIARWHGELARLEPRHTYPVFRPINGVMLLWITFATVLVSYGM